MRKYESEAKVVVVKQERNLKGSLFEDYDVVFFVAVHQ